MVVVAVAGGSGSVGRTIVEGIVATQKHEVKVLSRKPNPTLEAELGVPVIVVDYSDIAALTEALDNNNVQTVISGITMMHFEGGFSPEISLIRAADASKTAKRMIASDWGLVHSEDHLAQLPSAKNKKEASDVLKTTTNLEYTAVHNGFFMDYWGMPGVKSNLTPMLMMFDIPNNAAVIPGSGDVPVVYTHSTDIARFVAAMLDLEKWEPATFVKGDQLTLNEFLAILEEIKGTKFNVTYDGMDKLKRRQVTELPGQIGSYGGVPKEMLLGIIALFGEWVEEGSFNLKPQRFLNDLVPDLKPLDVRTMLKMAWGGA